MGAVYDGPVGPPDRERMVGGGDTFDRPVPDPVLLAAVWPRAYPTNGVLGL